MFGRNRRKLNNNAAIATAPPVPQKVEVRHEAVNYAPLALVGLLAIALMFPAGWYMLVYLMDAAGSRNPQQDAAYLIIGGGCVLPFLSLIAFGIAWVVSTTFDHREQMENIRGDWEYKKYMAMRQAVSGRVQSEDYRLVRLLEAVMFQAYTFIEENNRNYQKGDATPFARDTMKQFVLAGEREPVGFALAQKANQWLKAQGVVTNKNTVNKRACKDFGAFQELLRLEFDIPINVNGRNALPAQIEHGGYEFIEKT